ncbi:ABC transporter permease [Campylobacter sp. VicNov18]|uniref:ABC transporter permease n=1 Tax=Campylobacter bilis TaxID=2691918 RepID=UPI00130DC8C4|nr:ABC transporter permease [Campylobacter bilis]MPV63744.1 MlaE family lipid ABC transporter permease subunit [Campylobacter hepaticus]MBM0637245.1 MlaE family lipid ABC transporter permease subunit [Campylobacter bilis]MCC8277964.1 ABC transporter permease [Campylobacter bilis]MCC8299468.1 ABC transporter permease [Campylobacter bilis]MCC8300873.1 ABC transporter permease [Campylobacter bilis]
MSADFKLQNNTLFILGNWDKTSVDKIKIKDLLPLILSKEIILDFNSLKAIDTAGVRFFLALEYDLKNKNIKTTKQGLNSRFKVLFELCEKNYQRLHKQKKIPKDPAQYFINLGKLSLDLLEILKKFIDFTGAFFISLFSCFKHPKNFRFIAFLYHIENSALKALPIVILTALLVGVVLAYQAAYQLAQFGANIFIVDLMGISATRELAPLIAAIVIAGRSASSYTAQIGVMKLTDEIAAMNTMGFRSFEFIIIPRVMALVIAMPLIVAISDAISIIGGMVVAKLNLDISFIEFLRRFREAVALKHILIGLVKAPIFGFLIGIIACFRGFEVKNTTQSIGIYTTKSVVNAIFWVIAFDALFSVVLTSMGL